jgi:hypothetical protein
MTGKLAAALLSIALGQSSALTILGQDRSGFTHTVQVGSQVTGATPGVNQVMAPMSLQLPTAISIGAGTSTLWNPPLPAGAQVRITCSTATAVQFRSGTGSITAVLTDNEFLPPAVLDLTLLSSETSMAFFSTGGNTCKAALRNLP